MNEFSAEILGDVLRFARSITHLDISWNAMVPATMLPLVEILSKNRRLRYLNLAWNGLVDIGETEER
jgi:Ran GTPase-activating protein (RanGAP) involved in mRNA processing and transport